MCLEFKAVSTVTLIKNKVPVTLAHILPSESFLEERKHLYNDKERIF